MPYHFYHKYTIWNLNAIFYWKLSQLLLGGITVKKLKIICGEYSTIYILELQHQTINLFYPFKYCLCIFLRFIIAYLFSYIVVLFLLRYFHF